MYAVIINTIYGIINILRNMHTWMCFLKQFLCRAGKETFTDLIDYF